MSTFSARTHSTHTTTLASTPSFHDYGSSRSLASSPSRSVVSQSSSTFSNLTSVSRNALKHRHHHHGGGSNASTNNHEHDEDGESVTRSEAGRAAKQLALSKHSSKSAGNPMEPFCSEFGRQFDEGNLPICIDQGVVGASRRHIGWSVDILCLDFSYHLPLFLTGLVETDPPYNFLSYEGCLDMVIVGGPKNRLLPSLDKILPPLKGALQSGHPPSVSKALYVFLLLLRSDSVEAGGLGAMGRAIAPHLSRLLPTVNLYVASTTKVGPDGAYQVAESSLMDLVTELLETCEKLGPNGIYKIIKYAVPTYQSIKAMDGL